MKVIYCESPQYDFRFLFLVYDDLEYTPVGIDGTEYTHSSRDNWRIHWPNNCNHDALGVTTCPTTCQNALPIIAVWTITGDYNYSYDNTGTRTSWYRKTINVIRNENGHRVVKNNLYLRDEVNRIAFVDTRKYSNLSSFTTQSFNSVKPKSCSGWFSGLKNVTSVYNPEKLDFSEVKSTSGMFCDCTALITGLPFGSAGAYFDVSSWDTSNVENMKCMFRNCSHLVNVDVKDFDTKNVTDMSYMFDGCTALRSTKALSEANSIPNYFNGSGWNTNSVTNMSHMFEGCESLTDIDVFNFNTGAVNEMNDMFWL